MKSDSHADRAPIRRVAILATALLALLVVACGPATFTRTRTEFSPFSPAESRQEKEGVVAEIKFAGRSQLPPSFAATVQSCSREGLLLVDKSTGRPITEQVSLVQPGQLWEQVAITNNTAHVLRMNGVVIRLFDPSGGQFEPMNWGDIQSDLMGARPCPSTAVALNQFRVNRVFDRGMEIVPGSTSTFWVPFRPASTGMTGIWRFTIYDVPIRVDEAGRALRTTKFDIRVVSKQFVDTYTRANPMEPAKLTQSREVSDSSAAPKTQAAASPTPATPPPAATPEARPPAPATVTSRPPPTRATASQPSRDIIASAQTRLNALGFDAGTPDGGLGPRTRSAVSRFQASKGLAATGELTAETLSALGVSAASSPAAARLPPPTPAPAQAAAPASAPAEATAPAKPAPAAPPVKASQL